VGVKMVGNASGVCVGSGVEDGTASCVFCAWTVNATDVAIASSEAAVPQPTAIIDTIVKINVILRANLLLIRTSFHEAARKASAHYTRYKVERPASLTGRSSAFMLCAGQTALHGAY